NLPLAQQRDPAAIGTQAGPAGTAQCQDTGRWCNDRFCVRLFRCVVPEAQRSLIRPAQPVMARKKLHPLLTETMQPGAQQRRCLHSGGKHASGSAYKGIHAQTMHPVAQSLRIELLNEGSESSGSFTVAG